MDVKLKGLFEKLDVNEVSELLEKNMDFKLEDKSVSRIKALTFQKVKGKRKQSVLAKFENLRVAAVAACMFVVLGGSVSYAYYQTPVAYLDIDINPSIELGINRWERIVSAKAYNSDGEGILKGKGVLNKKVGEGVKALMGTANEQGFLDQEEGAAVAITSITDDADKAETLADISKEAVEEYTEEESLNVEIIIENISLKRIEEARQIGITPGKLNLIQKLQALDSNVTVEEYKNATVKEIMKTAIALKKDQKTNQKEKKVQTPEDSSILDENEDKELIEIKEADSDGKLEDEVENDKRNEGTIDKENKVNASSGNKPISPQDTKQNTKQDQGNKAENKQENKVENKQEKKAENKQENKVENKSGNKLENKAENKSESNQDNNQDNNQNIEQKNNQGNKQNSEQDKTDNAKQIKK